MSSDIVLYDSQDNIATITLNRPDKLNALSNTLVGELRDALIHFEASEDRVAVLTGAGERAFTAGADLRDPPRDPELWECMPGVGVPLTKPTIAAVAGHCVGGGVCLVEFCTLAVAADNADFSYPEAQLGFCGGLIAGLAVRIPYKVAMELMLTGVHMKAAARLRGRDGQRGRAGEAADGNRLRVRAQTGRKRSIGAGSARDVHARHAFAARPVGAVGASPAVICCVSRDPRMRKEGGRSFIEKRKPHFKGR